MQVQASGSIEKSGFLLSFSFCHWLLTHADLQNTVLISFNLVLLSCLIDVVIDTVYSHALFERDRWLSFL